MSRFIAQMEQLLWLYAQPYDPDYPVICFDERPCFLIGETVDPLAMQSGRVYKEHYSYEKSRSNLPGLGVQALPVGRTVPQETGN